ncbi:MAG TPA: RAD55 family ATPase [Kiritimatiellia bacterium]|nr:RAD55 family ATPase [Kiritimatiellia bacterium]
MIVDKTKLGLTFFDESFGGVYRGRQVLCWGCRGSGKSILACHFLNQALLEGDKALLLSKYRPQDTVIIAESIGMPFADAVTRGQLTILEYNTFIPESNASSNVMLPPQSFMELQETVESQSIRRVAFDTVLPWVAIQPTTRIAEHVYSFIHALERLGVTSLLTLPKPVSNAAYTLKNRLEDLCPVAVQLSHADGESRVLRVTKYLGESRRLSTPFPFVIVPQIGITVENAPSPVMPPSQPPLPNQGGFPPPILPNQGGMTTPSAAAPASAPTTRKPISFSSVIRFPE